MPQGARATFVAEPVLSDEHTVAALDTDVRRDLRGLQKDTADSVARHLVAAGSLVEEDPALALEHARYARRRASRIAVVREAAGIAAYHAGEWSEALAELRAARRMGGGPVHLPVMADIERALGRPERAVDIARGAEAAELDTAGRIELAIVGAGARRDLGELDAAVVGLQIPELDPKRREPWSGRLFYAYADNLLAAGRESDAVEWFVHAADADVDGETDAVGRLAALTGEDPDDADDFAFGFDEVAVVTEATGDAGPEGDVDAPVDDEPAVDVAGEEGAPAQGTVEAATAETRTEPARGDAEPADVDPAGAAAVGAIDAAATDTGPVDDGAVDDGAAGTDAAGTDATEGDSGEPGTADVVADGAAAPDAGAQVAAVEEGAAGGEATAGGAAGQVDAAELDRADPGSDGEVSAAGPVDAGEPAGSAGAGAGAVDETPGVADGAAGADGAPGDGTVR